MNRREIFMVCASAGAAHPPVDGLAPRAGEPDVFFAPGAVFDAEGAVPAVLLAAATLMLAPSLSRSVPSVTTVSPTEIPASMAVFLPSLGPTVILRTDTLLSALTKYT